MGTSQAARAPSTNKWKKVASALKAPTKNSATIVDLTVSIALPLVPSGYINTSLCYGIYEGLKFSNEVKEKGFERALKDEAIRISEKFVVSSVSNGIWDIASSKIDRKYVNSPFGKLTEVAFKKTMSTIMTKGIKSLEGE